MSIDARTVRIYTTLDSPLGELTLTASAGAIDGLFMDGQRHRPAGVERWMRDDPPFAPAAAQLARYFAGERVDFDLPLRPRGTPFQQRVWAALREIPYGETVSYGELIVIPCHRVIGADGSLTGYGGGLARKSWLLEHEGAVQRARRGAANLAAA